MASMDPTSFILAVVTSAGGGALLMKLVDGMLFGSGRYQRHLLSTIEAREEELKEARREKEDLQRRLMRMAITVGGMNIIEEDRRHLLEILGEEPPPSLRERLEAEMADGGN